MSLRRKLLWGFLVAALLSVALAWAMQRLRRPEPPPVLGHVPDFALTNRDGRAVRRADLAGSPWVADFVFTRCPASCPMMTARMARLERDLPARVWEKGTRLVSISVDPEHDTPVVLERYAASYKAPAHWLFLTGTREEIRNLSIAGFKLALDMSPPPDLGLIEPILHTTRFVLVDGRADIRGYYDAFDEESMRKLARDLEILTKEE